MAWFIYTRLLLRIWCYMYKKDVILGLMTSVNFYLAGNADGQEKVRA